MSEMRFGPGVCEKCGINHGVRTCEEFKRDLGTAAFGNAKLKALRAAGDAKRGRPLTDTEMLNNLAEAIWSCDRCDKPIETGWQFCPTCGWQLVEDDELVLLEPK